MISRGIKFNDIHSYHQLNLILSKVKIEPAQPKTNYIDIPGGDGSVDLTEALGEVKYYDREAEFTFTMNPAGDLSDSAFEAKKTEVSNALNGLYCQIILDKDADYYYEGRCTVSEYLSDRRLRQIVVTATLKPYKMKVEETVVQIALSSERQYFVLMNGRKTVTPKIICTNDETQVIFSRKTLSSVSLTFDAGEHESLYIQLTEGENSFSVKGTGTITFRYREGDL